MRSLDFRKDTKSAVNEALKLLTEAQFEEIFEVLENREVQKLVLEPNVLASDCKVAITTIRHIKNVLKNINPPV